MQGAVAIDYIYGGIWGLVGIREMLFDAEAQRAQREAQRTHSEGGWLVHFSVSGGSASGAGCGTTRRGAPWGRKRGGWLGMLPGGVGCGGCPGFLGFAEFAEFGWGGLTVSFAWDWVSRMGSFGNSWRRALRRSNSRSEEHTSEL